MANYYLGPDGNLYTEEELYHYGVLGMKWGVRRYQNEDGTLTPLGKQLQDLNRDADDASDKIRKLGSKAAIARRSYLTTGEFDEYEHRGAMEELQSNIKSVSLELSRRLVDTNKAYGKESIWNVDDSNNLVDMLIDVKDVTDDLVRSIGDYNVPGYEVYRKAETACSTLDRIFKATEGYYDEDD